MKFLFAEAKIAIGLCSTADASRHCFERRGRLNYLTLSFYFVSFSQLLLSSSSPLHLRETLTN